MSLYHLQTKSPWSCPHNGKGEERHGVENIVGPKHLDSHPLPAPQQKQQHVKETKPTANKDSGGRATAHQGGVSTPSLCGVTMCSRPASLLSAHTSHPTLQWAAWIR